MTKIVINNCCGGFSLSYKAVRFIADKGHEKAIELINEYDAKLKDPLLQNEIEKKYGFRWYGYLDIERNDPSLVLAVEALKEQAAGEYAELKVIEIPDDVSWEISEYNGIEHIYESCRTWS